MYDFGDKNHGDSLLSLTDKVAFTYASRLSAAYCLTVAMDDVEFWRLVDVGDLVALTASVHYVDTTSMLLVSKWLLKVCRRTIKHTNTGYVTMVAQDAEEKPQKVPLLRDNGDVQRFTYSIKRREINTTFRQHLARSAQAFTRNLDDAIQQLLPHRCEIHLR